MEKTKFMLNIMRKFYHLAAVALFIPAYFLNRDLLKTSMAIVSCGFALLECIRLGRFGDKLSAFLGMFMNRLRSGLDEGNAVLSHLLLLVGCAIPVWISRGSFDSGLAGTISLGITDSTVN